jgi:hypothetical protein
MDDHHIARRLKALHSEVIDLRAMVVHMVVDKSVDRVVLAPVQKGSKQDPADTSLAQE